MTLVLGDTLSTYGGALNDASPVANSSTDMGASSGNAAMAAVAGMSVVRTSAVVLMGMAGATNPTLGLWRAWWRATVPTAPVLTYTGTVGDFQITWPANVQDEIPLGAPGYTGPQPLNLITGWANMHVGHGGTAFDAFVSIAAPNVVNVTFFNVAGSEANPASGTVAIFMF